MAFTLFERVAYKDGLALAFWSHGSEEKTDISFKSMQH